RDTRPFFFAPASSEKEVLVSLSVTHSTQEDTIFDRTLDSSWDERSRRGLMTLTSFGLQALAVVVLLVLPLIRPQGLSSFRQLSTPISWGQPLGSPPVVRARTSANNTAPGT